MAIAETNARSKPRVRDGLLAGIGRFFREKPLGAVGAVMFFSMVGMAILAPLISPYDPLHTDLSVRLSTPTWEHWFGADELGRDLLTRVMYGAQISTLVGVGAVLMGSTIGALIGITSGYAGGRTDLIVQRIMDVLMSFPGLILAIALMTALGGSTLNLIIAISVPQFPRTNRVVRSVTIAVKEFQFVEAAKGVGASRWRIIWRHVLPNCMAAYLIVATAMLATAILIESSLSFLGLGVPPPAPSWGRSLSEAMAYMYRAPWMGVFPGMAISFMVFGINMFGDALRDVWDPRLKRL